MKTSYVYRGGGIIFPLLLTLLVCQVQGDCVDSRGKFSFQKRCLVKESSKSMILYIVQQCIITQGAEMKKVGDDFLRSCPIFYEMLKCVDSCSGRKKEIFNSLFAVSKIFENSI